MKLEIYSEQRTKAGVRSAKRSHGSSGLELKLDELRKELSSIHGGILPHSILSTQQISLLSSQKPSSLEQASLIEVILCNLVLCCWFLFRSISNKNLIFDVIQIYNFCFCLCVQLEKVIGKLKTEKYGSRILEQIERYSDFKPADEQGTGASAAKRSKTKKNLVLIESSEDEA